MAKVLAWYDNEWGRPAAWLNSLVASKMESMRDADNFLPEMGRMLNGARACRAPYHQPTP